MSNTSGTTASQTFPTSFTGTNYSVVTTCYHTTNANTYERYIQGYSKSGFTIHTYSDSSAPVYWIAIGY